MERSSQEQFRPRIFSLNASHHAATRSPINNVRHSAVQSGLIPIAV